jgi:GT2 family glycosyltransferase
MIRFREPSHEHRAERRIAAQQASCMSAVPSCAALRFAAVILNYNGGAMLSASVRSCIREGIPPAQIVVEDNGSRDGSIEDLSRQIFGHTRVRNSCNAGFARAVNQGIRQTTAEFFVLLNNDAQLDSGALSAFAEGFDARPNLAIAGAQLHHPGGRPQISFAPLPSVAEELLPISLLCLFAPDRFRRKTAQFEPFAVESVFGACLCVRTAFLPRLGLLDEDYFFFFEEVEWRQRARRMGCEVWVLPSATAEHGGGATANRFRGPARVEYQRSKLTFFRKTRSWTSCCVVSSFLVVRTSVNGLSCAVACLATLFLNRKLRQKAATYWFLLAWHLLLRPAGWGLPGKCPPHNDPAL